MRELPCKIPQFCNVGNDVVMNVKFFGYGLFPYINGNGILTLLTLPLLVVVWLLKWFVTFLHCCSAWIFYLLGSVLLATAVLSFLMKQSQGIEALQMLIGGFVIFMIPQVVGSVVVFLELAAATIRQVWYI